jgi:hypothetical protein
MSDLIKNNVSPLVSPDILANLKTSQQPKAFGDQLLKAGLAAGANAALNSTIARLYQQKTDLITEGIQLDIQHQLTLQQLKTQNTPTKTDIPPPLSDEEYTIAVANENKNYETAKIINQEKKDKNQKEINDYLKDPFAKQKEEIKKRKEARSKAKQKTNEEKRKSKQQKRNAVLKNARSLIPVLALLLTDRIGGVITQNDTIKKLVDNTNKIIIEANESNDPLKLNNAKIVRDNALRVIQSNEDKLNKINEQIKRISVYVTIFGIIISIINAILALPIPVLVPLKIRLQPILQRAIKILAALGALLSVILVSFQKALDILANYKAQLLTINGELDKNASPTPVTFGTDYPPYKGFKFALREENNPRFVVRGNKRHFAVAINKQNIEQLKSEPSFTLDPNDLIEQLKLVIDQQNLQG